MLIMRACSGSLLALLTLPGCATIKEGLGQMQEDIGGLSAALFGVGEPGPPLPPAALPSYRPGMRFEYTDGRAEEVVAVVDDRVVWEREDGDRYTMARNFIVPRLHAEQTRTVLSHRMFDDPDAIWPLEVGRSTVFRAERRQTRRSSSQARTRIVTYDCEVTETRRLTVPAGAFDTFRIACTRYRPDGRWALLRTWYYAPSLGHYVRREIHERNGRPEIVELERASS
jgi:hypothetical protein